MRLNLNRQTTNPGECPGLLFMYAPFVIPKRACFLNTVFFVWQSSYLERNRRYLERISSYLEGNRRYPERNSSYLERNSSYLKRIGSYPERIRSCLERNTRCLERIGSYLERLTGYLERNNSYSERRRTSDYLLQIIYYKRVMPTKEAAHIGWTID